jgi:tyrosyl-tRNA synthetase
MRPVTINDARIISANERPVGRTRLEQCLDASRTTLAAAGSRVPFVTCHLSLVPLAANNGGVMTDILSDLQWRGLLADCTDLEALRKRLTEGPVTLYCGFDPTGDSLHVGHLMGQLTLRRFQLAGHIPIALAGGATGMIGDPSGRSSERNLLTREQLNHNIASIKGQLSRLLDFNAPKNPARLVDNADWTAPISFLDFLRDIGKHFTLNLMLAKDSVKSRLEGEGGISYTEFSYQLLQAYDFYHLRNTYKCELQIGGSDQWGNITAGTDFIRKKLGVPAWGWTFPLITKSDGSKFGKTASGAVWLDPKQTSPYRFYQFFVNTEDAKVCEYLRKFTFLARGQIEPLEAAHAANPGAREAHKALAREVTTLVHGAEEYEKAKLASDAIFGGKVTTLPPDQLHFVAAEAPHKIFDFQKPELSGGYIPLDKPLIDAVVFSGLYPSKNQARQAIMAGGIYLNDQPVTNPAQPITTADLLYGQHIALRRGQRNYVFVSGVAPINQ